MKTELTKERIKEATKIAYGKMDAEAQLRRKMFIKINKNALIAMYNIEKNWKPTREYLERGK